MVSVPGMPRPLYPPDAKGHEPSEDGPDVEAYKRVAWRAGRWPGPASGFDRTFSNGFSHGKSGGNVGDSGIAGIQRQQNLEDTGFVGTATFNTLRSIRIPEGLPNAGQMAMDTNAQNLIAEAYKQFNSVTPKKTTRERALAGAQGDLGYVEGGNNDTFYGRWYGMNYQPYCAMAVSYWYEEDGGGSLSFAKGAAYSYCPYLLQDAQAGWSGLSITNSPIPGDVVLFDFQWDGLADHVGLFLSGNAQSFKTIEANTSPEGGGGSQSNGGGVYQRNRSQSSAQIWFVRVAEP
jgi:hypothetical protein